MEKWKCMAELWARSQPRATPQQGRNHVSIADVYAERCDAKGGGWVPDPCSAFSTFCRSSHPQPPRRDAECMRRILPLTSSMGLLWMAGGNPPYNPLKSPNSCKEQKRRDETPQHPHPSSELAPCHFSPAFGKGKWSEKGWVVGQNTVTCDFLWTILLFVGGELCWFGCKPTAKANPTVCIAFGLEGASLFSSPVCCPNLPVSVVRAVSPHLCSNANIAAAVVTLYLFCCSNFINCKPVHCLTMSYRNGFVYK